MIVTRSVALPTSKEISSARRSPTRSVIPSRFDGAETGRGHRHFVFAGNQSGEAEMSLAVRLGVDAHVGGDVADGHLGSDYDRAARIGDPAAKVCISGLRV